MLLLGPFTRHTHQFLRRTAERPKNDSEVRCKDEDNGGNNVIFRFIFQFSAYLNSQNNQANGK
jgi:hypothetical protein